MPTTVPQHNIYCCKLMTKKTDWFKLTEKNRLVHTKPHFKYLGLAFCELILLSNTTRWTISIKIKLFFRFIIEGYYWNTFIRLMPSLAKETQSFIAIKIMTFFIEQWCVASPLEKKAFGVGKMRTCVQISFFRLLKRHNKNNYTVSACERR